MVKSQPSKLVMRVRFPLPADFRQTSFMPLDVLSKKSLCLSTRPEGARKCQSEKHRKIQSGSDFHSGDQTEGDFATLIDQPEKRSAVSLAFFYRNESGRSKIKYACPFDLIKTGNLQADLLANTQRYRI